ncbi:MAG: UDP-N-acetylglucosamine 2-epimerase (non-hydrolyzing) [Planctomycetota bacterium]|nr:UDP-N-acetylglucosamine 2-epimerase (non-hydrolyzing) [Planctomycetota bacterium]
MKILTVLGTRPEIIRLSRIIPLLDKHCEHTLVHTGQNDTNRLSQIFFDELEVRKPDAFLGVRAASPGAQIGNILTGCEKVIRDVQPDRLLILGDTNSALSAFIAKRMALPIYHMEAGNRCFDDRVPEEVNRRVIDHCSDILMPYTERSRANLIREGFASNRVFVTGNPIGEVMAHNESKVDASTVLKTLGVEKKKYFLVTMHRQENVDVESRLRSMTLALEKLHEEYQLPIICSLHPRTRDRMLAFGLSPDDSAITFMEPFGFCDFVHLEKNAFCVLSDSGTVQEECCLMQVPNVTLRDVTERPETIECGSNILAGADFDAIIRSVRTVVAGEPDWTPPPEYLAPKVSETVLRILLGL